MEFLNEKILALSWKQPFASLMLHGKIETRVWPTNYRGLVLICASLKPYSDTQILNICGKEQYLHAHKTLNGNSGLPGHAIAIGKLVHCRPMVKEDEDKCFVEYQEPWLATDKNGILTKKAAMGIKTKLWCHIYEDVKPIEPFPWSGTQGWKEVTEEQKKQIILL